MGKGDIPGDRVLGEDIDMAGVYRPRYPERTVLYRVLFHDFDKFLNY